ncbi:MAG: sensor histidine kinase [Alphaproteobacteria bacterium]
MRWRQLVELVARSSAQANPRLIEQAIHEIRSTAPHLDERIRSAAAVAIAPLRLPVSLIACFAAEPVSIAAPVLAAARLTPDEWNLVASEASKDCRVLVAAIRSGEAQPIREAGKAEQYDLAEEPQPIPSISDVVARIERIRQQRETESDARPSLAESENASRLFRWECNEAGQIDWVEGAPRGALVGQSIAQAGPGSGVDPGVERAFAARAPFHEGLLELPPDSKIGGAWKISGIPAFEPATGRFAGYCGVAERPGAGHGSTGSALDAASLRELAHEIKTPLNAIIGFAEIITGEYLGPAGMKYRERASEIVAQARLLHEAVEDLDLAARVGANARTVQADLAAALAGTWEEIERAAKLRGIRLSVLAADDPLGCSVDPQLAARLVQRLCRATIENAARGEALTIRMGTDAEWCTLSLTSPASLKGVDLSPERNRRAADLKTLPFRLVRGLARTAGGELHSENGTFELRLPRA